jgi:hypothetical protein
MLRYKSLISTVQSLHSSLILSFVKVCANVVEVDVVNSILMFF